MLELRQQLEAPTLYRLKPKTASVLAVMQAAGVTQATTATAGPTRSSAQVSQVGHAQLAGNSNLHPWDAGAMSMCCHACASGIVTLHAEVLSSPKNLSPLCVQLEPCLQRLQGQGAPGGGDLVLHPVGPA